MHIGVDATGWQNKRGYGRHMRALLSTLVPLDAQNRYTFFMDSTQDCETVPAAAQVELVHSAVPTVLAASSKGNRSLGDMLRMSRAMSKPGFDLLLFPTVYSYVPVFSRAKKLVMLHDVIAEKYPQLTLPSRAARLFWKTKVALGRWQADAIITVSDYARQGLAEHFKINPDQILVVGEASDPIFRVLPDARPTLTLTNLGINSEKRYIVYVGGFAPHKNLEMLLSVFASLVPQAKLADLHLVMVGEYQKEVFHSYFDVIKRQVDDLGIAERVIFTGYLPDEQLVVLLNLATVLVLPSLMEGFGLPAVEAVACGCPVIATTHSPLPGLLGNAGLYVDPTRPEEWRQALIRVLNSDSLRQNMRSAGLATATRLTWDTAARQMLDVIQELGAA
jgi:glycosyltransferase involved in cell wall biosynthesis